MTSKLKMLWVALIAVAIIAVLGLFTPMGATVQSTFGGVTNYDELDATAIKIGGTNGSRVGPIIVTTCSLLNADASIAASSTGYTYCSVPGVVSGDIVFSELSTTSASTLFGSWNIQSAKASTTAGFIDIMLTRNGAAAIPSVTSIGSSTDIQVWHPRSTVPGL